MIEINREKCVKCGACVAVCPAEILGMEDQGPEELRSRGCIVCGHCEAVCPVEAVEIEKAPLAEQTKIKEELKISVDQAKQFMRSRRSIRAYKENQKVPREKVIELLNMARMAPTGSNTQGTVFIVVEEDEKMNQLREGMANYFEEWAASGDPLGRGYRKFATSYRNGKDTLLRGAPQLILALNQKKKDRAENGQFALTYAELFAPVLGIGTCWAGFFMWYANAKPDEIAGMLNIPDDLMVSAALMMGIPKYTYRRLPERNSLSVEWH